MNSMNTMYAYESFYSIEIEADTHDSCLYHYNRLKDLSKAFQATIIKESKSARKGDVLNRNLQIKLTAYAHETIIFRESIDIIIHSINAYKPMLKAYISLSEMIPKDARFGLPE